MPYQFEWLTRQIDPSQLPLGKGKSQRRWGYSSRSQFKSASPLSFRRLLTISALAVIVTLGSHGLVWSATPQASFLAQIPSITPSPNPSANEVDDRLFLAGMDDPQEVHHFLAQLRQAAVMDGSSQEQLRHRQILVNLVRFPFTIYSGPGIQELTYHQPEALLRDFDRVFTPNVLEAMRHAQYEELFINDQGAMFSSGRVWFDQREDGIKIKAINR